MKMRTIALALAGALATATATATFAASFTLFGNASIVSGGNPIKAAQIVSDGGNATPYGGVDLVATTVTTLSTLTFLGTDYQMTAGDCGGGSPRFEIGVPAGNIFVYLGPAPNYTGCTPGWQSSGNLLAGSVDTSQIGGTFYDTWAHALVLAGGSTVAYIDIVVDAGWAAPPVGPVQTALVDNVRMNDEIVTFDPLPPPANANDCKNNGWKNVSGPNGPFKSQGDCIQFVNTGK